MLARWPVVLRRSVDLRQHQGYIYPCLSVLFGVQLSIVYIDWFFASTWVSLPSSSPTFPSLFLPSFPFPFPRGFLDVIPFFLLPRNNPLAWPPSVYSALHTSNSASTHDHSA